MSRIFNFSAALFVSLLTLAPLNTAQAQSYTVGVENIEYYPQYTIVDGKYGGFGREVLDRFAKDSGITFDYVPLPVARLFADFVNKKVDFKYPDNSYWSSDLKDGKGVIYSDPVVAYIDGVSVLAANKGKNVSDFKTLGTVKGFTAWDWLSLVNEGKVSLLENSNFSGLVQQALLNRVDGAYANIAVVNHTLEKLGKAGELVFDESLPHTKSFYHFSSIKHPMMVEKFNAWMKANSDAVAEMKNRYGLEQAK